MEHIQLSPDRMAHVEDLAALDDRWPDDAEILDLSDAERIEFAKLMDHPSISQMIDEQYVWRLIPFPEPWEMPLSGAERVLAEQALIAVMRAYAAVWPQGLPELKRKRRNS